MFIKLCNTHKSDGIFKKEFRNQFLTSLSVTIITLCHGIGIGWLSPMLAKLQSVSESPLGFVITVEEASWIGALISMGGFFGNIVFGCILDRIGRKGSIYCLAVPHACLWVSLYFARSIEYLYVARICAGLTGGGVYVVLPIFIGEIADPSIRGRLTSLFSLTLNTGILTGYILSTHLPYHLIPCIVIALPMLYVIFASFYPETPQHLLRCGREDKAEKALKFYKNYQGKTKAEIRNFSEAFIDLKMSVAHQKSENGDVGIGDFFTKRSLKALGIGVVLMILNIYCGSFALLNYMSSIFAATKSELHPDTNTICIGAVQIIGAYTATVLVDRFGRKVLMIISTAGMGFGLAAFGMYAFFAEETEVDLSSYSSWLPLVLMAFIIFLANIGIIPVTFVVLVEIMPAKIRAQAASFCLALLSAISFGLLKAFPIFMHTFGVSATMWFCATVCASGLLFITIFLKETKGKSMDKEDFDD